MTIRRLIGDIPELRKILEDAGRSEEAFNEKLKKAAPLCHEVGDCAFQAFAKMKLNLTLTEAMEMTQRELDAFLNQYLLDQAQNSPATIADPAVHFVDEAHRFHVELAAAVHEKIKVDTFLQDNPGISRASYFYYKKGEITGKVGHQKRNEIEKAIRASAASLSLV